MKDEFKRKRKLLYPNSEHSLERRVFRTINARIARHKLKQELYQEEAELKGIRTNKRYETE